MTDDFSSQVIVDLREMRDVAIWLRHEAQSLGDERQNLQPTVHFGHYSPCGQANLARRTAMSALEAHRSRWDHHRQELAALAAKLEKAVDEYASSDELRKLDR